MKFIIKLIKGLIYQHQMTKAHKKGKFSEPIEEFPIKKVTDKITKGKV